LRNYLFILFQENWLHVVLSRVKQLSGLSFTMNIDSDLKKYSLAPVLQDLIDILGHLLPLDIDYAYFNIPSH
jgi:hypothetical protein